MSTADEPTAASTCDHLIDEVRAIRRAVCDEFGNDVGRLVKHLREVEDDYAFRRGLFAGVTKEAAAHVAESWGELPARTDDPIVDEVRAIRKKLAEERK